MFFKETFKTRHRRYPRSKAILRFRFEGVNSFCESEHMEMFFRLRMIWLMSQMCGEGFDIRVGGLAGEISPIHVRCHVRAHQNLMIYRNCFEPSRVHDIFHLKCTKSRRESSSSYLALMKPVHMFSGEGRFSLVSSVFIWFGRESAYSSSISRLSEKFYILTTN